MLLLANKNVRKKALKASKNVAKAALIVGGAGALAYSAYKLLKRTDFDMPADMTTNFTLAPEASTSAEVEKISHQIFDERMNAIEQARIELLAKLELKNQQHERITNLQQQIEQKKIQIENNNQQYIVPLEREIENLQKNVDSAKRLLEAAQNVYNAAWNDLKDEQNRLAREEYKLDEIYDKNQIWNPAWYIEKGNQERLVQQLRSNVAMYQNEANAQQSRVVSRTNDYNIALESKKTAIERLNSYKSTYITTLQNELTALQQTLAMYQITFDAISEEIAKLQKITSGA